MAVDWGDIFRTGVQALGNYAAVRVQARYGQPMQIPASTQPQYLPGWRLPVSPGDIYGVTGGSAMQNASYVVPALPSPSGGGVMTAGVATVGLQAGARLVSALLPRLRALFPTLAEAGLIAMGTALITGGIGHDAAGPYAKASDNKLMGIMRGDVKAIRRVKRQGARLSKVLRAAGYGHRRQSRRPQPRRRLSTRRLPPLRVINPQLTAY